VTICRMRHMATGEHALVQPLPDGLCIAQFDRFDHPHSHGWHLYVRRAFQIVRQRLPRTPAAAQRLRAYQEAQRVSMRWNTVMDARPRHGSPTARHTRPPETQRLS
jgi:hypothetical protein